MGVQVRLESSSLVGIRSGEQVVIEADLGVDGVARRDPVKRRLDLAPVRSIAAAGVGIVGAVELDDVAAVVLDDILTLDEVCGSKTNFMRGLAVRSRR